jgi:hypothetical protein
VDSCQLGKDKIQNFLPKQSVNSQYCTNKKEKEIFCYN